MDFIYIALTLALLDLSIALIYAIAALRGPN